MLLGSGCTTDSHSPYAYRGLDMGGFLWEG